MELNTMLELYLSQLRESNNKHKFISYSLWEFFVYYFTWKKTNNGQFSPIKDGLPWINLASIKFLNRIITPQMRIFEFGAGGSSIFFAKKAYSVVSIEHDKTWFTNVEKEIAKHNLSNWKGYCIEPTLLQNIDNEPDISNPHNYLSGDLNYKEYSFKNYASYIDNYENNSFDIVFIDGRARPSCLMHSMSKVKNGGYLVLDNADISYYMTYFDKNKLNGGFEVIFDKFGAGPYSSLFWETIIWKKNN